MKPWHSAWWPAHPRACFVAAAALSTLAGALLAETAEAKTRAPSTAQVSHRMGQATDRMLEQRGMRVAGLIGVSCRPGTRSDPTRKVRWWCLLEQRDELGEVVWRTRVRLRWHRDRAKTVVTWRMAGVISGGRELGGHLTSEVF